MKKRSQRANLSGYTALITGARIKIGFQVALKLLRDGARVIITTRFPADALRRYRSHKDAPSWLDHLNVYGLDFLDLNAVTSFIRFLYENYRHLEILINNAAQTIRSTPEEFRKLVSAEHEAERLLPKATRRQLAASSPYSDGSDPALPQTEDQTQQALIRSTDVRSAALALSNRLNALSEVVSQRDPLTHNSWTMRLDEIPIREFLEVQVINFIVPFILCSQLKPLLIQSPFRSRFIENVSAMEGKFSRRRKTVYHAHTNTAKAALNMLTRTASSDYAQSGVFMNSIDTGWINDENPPKISQKRQESGFSPPLDTVDAAARICDPIYSTLNGKPAQFGKFLKNYSPTEW